MRITTRHNAFFSCVWVNGIRYRFFGIGHWNKAKKFIEGLDRQVKVIIN